MKFKALIVTTTVAFTCSAVAIQNAVQPGFDQAQDQQEQPIQDETDPSLQPDSNQQDDGFIIDPSGGEQPADPGQAPGEFPHGEEIVPGQEQPIEDLPGTQPANDPQPAPGQRPGINDPAGAQPQPPSGIPLNNDPIAPQPVPQPNTSLQSDTGFQDPAGAKADPSELLASALGTLGGRAAANGAPNIQLRQAILASIEGKNVPNEFVDRLSQDLGTAFTRAQVQQSTRTELADAMHKVFTAKPTAQNEIEQALSQVQTILMENGASRPAARAVAYDLHLIATEMHPDLKLPLPMPRK